MGREARRLKFRKLKENGEEIFTDAAGLTREIWLDNIAESAGLTLTDKSRHTIVTPNIGQVGKYGRR